MKIGLDEHFDKIKLRRFIFPSVVMLIFSSIYVLVDGLFISNYCSVDAFAGVNFVFPFIQALIALGMMFGAGGSALIAKTIGEKNLIKARSYFSFITYSSIVIGVIFTVALYFALPPVMKWLGATGELLDSAIIYGQALTLFIPAAIVQMAFQAYFITAEKSKIGTIVTVASGCLNILLDYLFIGVLKMDVLGAALGTGLCHVAGAVASLIFFFLPNKTSLLRLGKCNFEFKGLLKSITNGSSELVTYLSTSTVVIIYNAQLLKYVGNTGVAAYGVLMYVILIFLAVYFGYNLGVAPLVSYNYGAQNHPELQNLTKKSINFILIASILMTVLCYALAYPMTLAFASQDQALFDLTLKAFWFFSASFLFAGICVFTSAFFTSLNNGLVSAIMSLVKTLICPILCVYIFPLIMGADGIWVALILQDALASVVAFILLFSFRKRYHYFS